jgi:glutathione peroxidase
MSATVHTFEMQTIQGAQKSLADFKDHVLVIVNVASKCGLTPQYAELEAFHNTFKDRNVQVLGFPANNFGAQEPGSDAEILEFCTTNFGVDFPMFSKISVKGDDQHPLYLYLTETTGKPVTWNFQKFIVDKHGEVKFSFEPTTSVQQPEFVQAVESLL